MAGGADSARQTALDQLQARDPGNLPRKMLFLELASQYRTWPSKQTIPSSGAPNSLLQNSSPKTEHLGSGAPTDLCVGSACRSVEVAGTSLDLVGTQVALLQRGDLARVREPIPYALETDWPVGAAGFEPLHLEIRSAELHPA
jgi:hypothetical protein